MNQLLPHRSFFKQPSSHLRKGRLAKTCGVMLGAVIAGCWGVGERAIAQTEVAQTTTEQAATGQTAIGQGTTPEDVSAIAPPSDPVPTPIPFTPIPSGITDVSQGMEAVESVGHLRPSEIEAAANGVAWLQSVNLPLYVTPGGDHWGWIYKGWLIPKGQTYLAIGRDAGFAMVRAYEELYTFPVVETRADGWFRVQYTPGGSAWAHTSQLGLGDVPLTVETWENHLQAQEAVYFLDSRKAQALRSQPQQSTNMVSLVAADSLIEASRISGRLDARTHHSARGQLRTLDGRNR